MLALSLLILALIGNSCATCPAPKPVHLVQCTFALVSVEHPQGGLLCAERSLDGPPATSAKFMELKDISEIEAERKSNYIVMPLDSYEALLKR